MRALDLGRREAELLSWLAAIVDSSDDAIISKDLNGIIQTWNGGAERLFGYRADEVIGKPVTILMPPERLNEEPGILARVRKGQRVDHYETIRRKKDGTLVDISLTVSPICDATGTIVGASKIARDITGQKRRNELLERAVAERTSALRSALEQMEEFSYSVSHDLRAPLRAIDGYAGALLEDYAADLKPTAREYLESIQRSSHRMERLTRDLLDYSRLARGEARLEAVDAHRLVLEIVAHYQEFQLPHSRVTIQGVLPRVMAHETTLGQCVANLLSNAVKFVAPGVQPEILIRGEERDGKVRLWFEDNGIGIPPSQQHRIFAMFERLPGATNYEGTGIGLAVVRKAMDKMGGATGVESEGEGGSRFWLELKSVANHGLHTTANHEATARELAAHSAAA